MQMGVKTEKIKRRKYDAAFQELYSWWEASWSWLNQPGLCFLLSNACNIVHIRHYGIFNIEWLG